MWLSNIVKGLDSKTIEKWDNQGDGMGWDGIVSTASIDAFLKRWAPLPPQLTLQGVAGSPALDSNAVSNCVAGLAPRGINPGERAGEGRGGFARWGGGVGCRSH